MLARVQQARATRDIDLAAHASSLDHAEQDLTNLAAISLDDHLAFELLAIHSLYNSATFLLERLTYDGGYGRHGYHQSSSRGS